MTPAAPRRATRAFALGAALCGLAACASARGGRDAPLPAGCHPELDDVVLRWAQNAVADRGAENRHRLPWTDTLPPAPVRDAAICRRAALATVGGRLPPGATARASVVRAGGLYFVLGPGDGQAGEFLVVDVLDAAFRHIVGIAG